MCVAAIAWQAHRDWLLVAVGNRDEFHARPAAPLARWDEGILAGRDLKSGGTWLGVHEDGRFALVTNLRGHGGPDPDKASRGALVTDLLTGTGPYADPASAPLADFNPFNLFLAGKASASFLSNRPGDLRTALGHGIYGLSNGPLDEPWPKTLQLKAALSDWLVEDEGNAERLFAAMRNERLDAIGVSPSEPSDIAAEAPQTPVFIHDPVYGTRCSTVIMVDRAGQGRMIERRFDAAGNATGDSSLKFSWEI
jgi:uncharacterized protein with NRDE domain